MLQLMGSGIPLQEGEAEGALEQGLMRKLGLMMELSGGFAGACQSPPGSADPCWGYYPLRLRTKPLCSVQSHDLSTHGTFS